MGRRPNRFEPDALVPVLASLTCDGRWCIAFSGGADSTALLLAFAALRAQLPQEMCAFHVDHGVHPDSARWAHHCQSVCDALQIPLTRFPPPRAALPPDSPEAQLRQWRYDVMADALEPGDILCTAHHLEDQAETVMLALLRGSGPGGLAAMPTVRPLGSGQLARPLLPIRQQDLHDWLATQSVPVIDDPSNAQTDADRNYLRHEVLPRLRSRWPGADQALAQSAQHCAETTELMQDPITLALTGRCPQPGVLDLHGIDGAQAALPALIRDWLTSNAASPLPRARLSELLRQLAEHPDANRICLAWADHELRHDRGLLWLDPPPVTACEAYSGWQGTGTLDLGPSAGTLSLTGNGTLPFPVDIAPRQAGDRFQRRAGQARQSLKDWLRRLALPPWLRPALPVLRQGDAVLAVGDQVLSLELREALDAQQTQLNWTPADPGLAWAWSACSGSGHTLK